MIPSEINAVIFDMDGLLIDSEPAWNRADEQFLATRHLPLPKDITTLTLGLGQKEAIAVFQQKLGLLGDPEELIAERKELFYKELFADLRLMPKAEDFVLSLKDKGYILAIATGGHTKEKAEEILQKLSIRDYFSVVVSSDDVKQGKPHPDVYLATAEKLGVIPGQCLVLEDAPNGVLAGKAAGMNVYGVNTDEILRAELTKAGADLVFTNLGEIFV